MIKIEQLEISRVTLGWYSFLNGMFRSDYERNIWRNGRKSHIN